MGACPGWEPILGNVGAAPNLPIQVPPSPEKQSLHALQSLQVEKAKKLLTTGAFMNMAGSQGERDIRPPLLAAAATDAALPGEISWFVSNTWLERASAEATRQDH